MQTFVRALYAAHAASEAVFYFDLRSEEEVSTKKWDILLNRQREAFRALHEVCCRIKASDLVE